MNLDLPMLAVALVGLLSGLLPAPPSAATADGYCASSPPQPPCIVQVAASSSVWKFTRTQGPKEGETFAAIMKTADTTQSDPDFAGLIVRCAPGGKVDVLVALIRPFPPRSRPRVTIVPAGGGSLTFEASVAGAGVAVLLPDEVSAFAAAKWQTTPSLTISVKENDSEIKGMVALNGLREAYNSLLASCSL